jgi:hypothetical protein
VKNGLGGSYHRPHSGCVAADQHDGDAATHEIDRHPGHAVILTFGPAILEVDIAARHEAGFGEAATKCSHVLGSLRRRCAVEDSDHRHRLLLRVRRERPRCRRAAEQRDELAATDVDCHVTLPMGGIPTQWRDDITL